MHRSGTQLAGASSCYGGRTRRSGKIALVAMLLLLFMVILIGLIGNTGHVTSQKMETQNAVDAVAFSQAMWRARALNTITASNHLMGEATALCVIQEAWGGPELRLGLKANTNENRQLDTLIRLAAKNAPMGRYPSPYVPAGLTGVDDQLIRFVTDRTSPEDSEEQAAFATLYDARMTLKRRLFEMLAAKWVANFLFLVPPPIGYGTAVIGYGVHIVSTARIVLIGKEWLLLEVIEKYAKVAAPVHEQVFQNQLIPTLQEFALEIAGVDAESGQSEASESLIARASQDALEQSGERQQTTVAVYPASDEFQLPVEVEPEPELTNFNGSYPSGWGEDTSSPIAALGDQLSNAQRELSKALSRTSARMQQLREAVAQLDELESELRDRIDANEAAPAIMAEMKSELIRVEEARAEVELQLEELEKNVNEISQQRSELDTVLSQAGALGSENLSLDHIPQQMNPDLERVTQWTRATTPNVDALRAPLLGLLKKHLTISQAAKHFEKWTNRYTLVRTWALRSGQRLEPSGAQSASWRKQADPWFMLVMRGTYREQLPHKGSESWTGSDSAGRNTAEDLFTLVAASHREYEPLFSTIVYPQPQTQGLVTFAQAIVYNANPQSPSSGSANAQAQVGWDTLNWDAKQAVNEWGATAEVQATSWPWELLSGIDNPPAVRLNWQPKLVPLTARRLEQAEQVAPGDGWNDAMREALSLAIEHSELIRH